MYTILHRDFLGKIDEMALDQPRSAVPPKAHSEVVKNELRKIDDEEIYDSLCEYTQVYIVTVSAQKIAPY